MKKGGLTMVEKTLLMTFVNEQGAKASISLSGIRDDIKQTDVAAAMDVIISKNIFQSKGGNLTAKSAAQITERNVTELTVK
jgi:hypothetical protein